MCSISYIEKNVDHFIQLFREILTPTLSLLSHDLSVRVANELGAGNARSAAFSATVATIISTVISLCIAVLIMVFRDKISYIFTGGEVVANAVSELCPLLAISIAVSGVQPVLSGN